MKSIILFIFALVFSFFSSASPVKIGNGGLVAYCKPVPEKEISSIELPDFLEGRLRWDLKLKIDHPHESWEMQVRQAIERLETRSPYRAQQYRTWLETFMQDSKFVDGFELPATNDAFYLPFPLDCKLQQAVVQIEPEVARDKRYYINLKIWNELSESQKAGLVLHELIYREALKNNFSDSKWIRYFNALIWSDTISEGGLSDWSQLFIDLLKVNYFEWEGFRASRLKQLSNGKFELSLISQVPPFTFLNHWNIEKIDSGTLVLDSKQQIESMRVSDAILSTQKPQGELLRFPLADLQISDWNTKKPLVNINFIRNGDFQSNTRLTKDWFYDADDFVYGYLARPGDGNKDGILKLRKGAVSRVCQKMELPANHYNFKMVAMASGISKFITYELLDGDMKVLKKQRQKLDSEGSFKSLTQTFKVDRAGFYYLCLKAEAKSDGAWVRFDDLSLMPTDLEFMGLLSRSTSFNSR